MQSNYDVIVIGGGPAGCSAAMFIARCKWKVLIIDMDNSKGYLSGLGNISCFPGFPESLKGRELLERMRKQAELEGVKFQKDKVSAIAADNAPIKIMTDNNGEFTSSAVVVATGAASRSNYLHGEKELLGKGVSHDALADAPSIAKRITAVIGRNKRSAEATLFLSRFAEKVHFVIPSSKLDVSDHLLDKLQNNKAVEMHFSTSLKRINGSDHVKSINILSSGQEKELDVAGVFTYVHDYQPTTAFLEKIVDLSESGSVKVDQNMATSIEGIFACGDALCGRPQLPAISAAQGVLTGVNIDGYLSKK
ncbi:MAG: FAD-dependent oxidoreductase [Deltaproteobacteria bacterium]|jgi:thioredoxin reductase (NADPH)|nr:FAD-dependent oxidoreductase [Deltaproteobacteria bacterium]